MREPLGEERLGGNEREKIANQRDNEADKRDRIADERDRIADERESRLSGGGNPGASADDLSLTE